MAGIIDFIMIILSSLTLPLPLTYCLQMIKINLDIGYWWLELYCGLWLGCLHLNVNSIPTEA